MVTQQYACAMPLMPAVTIMAALRPCELLGIFLLTVCWNNAALLMLNAALHDERRLFILLTIHQLAVLLGHTD